MNVVVTGANGFIGSEIIKHLSFLGHKVYAIVRSEKSDTSSINLSDVEIIVCEMQNIKELKNKISGNVDSCIHLAWEGSYGPKKSDYNIQIKNVQWTMDLIETLSTMNVNKLICSGTIAEKEIIKNFGTGSNNLPSNYYAIAKVATHTMSEILCNKKGIGLNWCYVSNTYGHGDKSSNFINSTILKMLSGERASFSSGNQIYDFTYIDDVVNVMLGILSHGVPGKSYYIGSSEPRPLKDYITAIRDAIDNGIPLYFGEVPSSGSSLKLSDYNIFDIIKDVGYRPQYSFEEGIRLTINDIKDR